MTPVTDPSVLSALESEGSAALPSGSQLRPVTNPDLLAQLEQPESPELLTGSFLKAGSPDAATMGAMRPSSWDRPDEDFAGKRLLYNPMNVGDYFAELLARIPGAGRLFPEGGAAKDVVRTIGSTASSFTSTPRDILLTVAPVPGFKAISQPLKQMASTVFPRATKLLTTPLSRLGTVPRGTVPLPTAKPPLAVQKPPGEAIGPTRPILRPTASSPSVAGTGGQRPILPSQFEIPIGGGAVEGAPLPKYAGSINLERLNTTDDVKKMIDQTASVFQEQVSAARRGRVSFEETKRMAARLSMTPEDLLKKSAGTAFNEAQGLVARQINVTSASHLFDQAKRFSAGEISREQFKAAWARHAMIQSAESGVATEAGRALGARRIMISPEEFKARTLKEIMDRLPEGDITDAVADRLGRLDPTDFAAINQFLRSVTKATKLDMVYEGWISSLLSGPITHVVNTVSNGVAAASAMVERATAGALDIGRHVLVGTPRERFVGEATADLYGSLAGLKEGLRKGLVAFQTEIPSQGASKIEGRVMQAIPGKTGRVIRVPLRALMAEDEVFKAVNYTGAIHATAYRQAAKEGLAGKALAERVAVLTANPSLLPHTAIEAAKAEMLYRTFQQPLGPIGRTLYRLREQTVIGKFIVPFLRTPINITKYGLERTPLNLIRLTAKQISGSLKGAAALDEWAKATTGSLVALGTVLYAADGKISGGGPTESGQRAALFRTGWQPYSVKIGKTWYSYARIEPLATIMGISADFSELSGAMSEPERAHLASKIGLAISTNLTNKTFLSGLSAALNAVSDPERYGNRWINQFAGSVVPSGVATAERAMDPTFREVRTTLDTIRSRVPIVAKGLPPKLDLWGQPIQRPGSTLSRSISPVIGSIETGTETDAEMVRLKLNIVPPRPQLTLGKQIIDLEPPDATDYRRTAGLLAKIAADAVVRSGAYATLSDDQRRELIAKAIASGHAAARDATIAVIANRASAGQDIKARRR